MGSKPELMYLACAAALTGVLFLPYVLDRMLVWGLPDTVGYPADPKPQSGWAQRMKKAHANAVENLVVFATLMLVAQAMGLTAPLLVTASALYFWGRVVHALAYTFAWPWVRTLGFGAGFVAQAMVAWLILMR